MTAQGDEERKLIQEAKTRLEEVRRYGSPMDWRFATTLTNMLEVLEKLSLRLDALDGSVVKIHYDRE